MFKIFDFVGIVVNMICFITYELPENRYKFSVKREKTFFLKNAVLETTKFL